MSRLEKIHGVQALKLDIKGLLADAHQLVVPSPGDIYPREEFTTIVREGTRRAAIAVTADEEGIITSELHAMDNTTNTGGGNAFQLRKIQNGSETTTHIWLNRKAATPIFNDYTPQYSFSLPSDENAIAQMSETDFQNVTWLREQIGINRGMLQASLATFVG